MPQTEIVASRTVTDDQGLLAVVNVIPSGQVIVTLFLLGSVADDQSCYVGSLVLLFNRC